MSYSQDQLLAELERDEGLRVKPYTDTRGKLTIGIGRNLTDVGISADEARRMAVDDIERAEHELDRVAPFWRGLSDRRQRVLLNMVFNMGEAKLAEFHKFLAAAAAGDFETAAKEMLASAWANEVHERAQRLAAMMRAG